MVFGKFEVKCGKDVVQHFFHKLSIRIPQLPLT